MRKELTKHFVAREFVAIYSRIVGLALAFYCSTQFENNTLVLWLIGVHLVSAFTNRHFAHRVLDAMARGEDGNRQAHHLAISMGVAAFLWGCFLWTFPQTLLRTPAEFIITLAVLVAIALMMVTAALHSAALRYTTIGACLSIVPAIVRFTPISGFAPAVGFIVLIVILLVYARLFERQGRSLALLQLRNKRVSEQLTQVNDALVGAMGRLRLQADRDALTKMRNRGAFERAADKMLKKEDAGTQFVVMLIDIDHFKTINDNFGHTTGDIVLTHIGSLLHEWEKQGHGRLSARWGGEEFVVLAQLEKGKTTGELAEELRLCLRVENCAPDLPKTLHTSVSIGCSVAKIPFSIEKEIRSADIALYRAKNEGRDCWRIAV